MSNDNRDRVPCQNCGKYPVQVNCLIPADLSCDGKEKIKPIKIDACIAGIVQALHRGNINMRGSCCGHGKADGDIHLQDGRLLIIKREGEKYLVDKESEYKNYWGNPCEKHENVEAWVARCKVDNEGLHCFGCFIEYRESTAAVDAVREIYKKLKEAIYPKDGEFHVDFISWSNVVNTIEECWPEVVGDE